MILSGLGASIATAAATFSARDQNREAAVTGVAGSISDVTDATDGTKGATLSVALPAELAATAGFYWGQFKVTYVGGTIQTVPGSESLTVEILPSYELLDEADVDYAAQTYLQTQAAHGFAALDLIRFDTDTWSKAQADDGETLAQAIVVSAPSSSTFRMLYLTNREATFAAHGHTGLLYLSQATAGAITSTAPTTGIVQLVAVVKDENTLILQAVTPEFV